jgi:hypothetical protein
MAVSGEPTVALRWRAGYSRGGRGGRDLGDEALDQGLDLVADRADRVDALPGRVLEKANTATTHSPLPTPLWHDREDIIQRLCGLKE